MGCIPSLRRLDCSSLSLFCSIHVCMQERARMHMCVRVYVWFILCACKGCSKAQPWGVPCHPSSPSSLPDVSSEKTESQWASILAPLPQSFATPSFCSFGKLGQPPDVYLFVSPTQLRTPWRQKLLYQSLNSQRLEECLAYSRHSITRKFPSSYNMARFHKIII